MHAESAFKYTETIINPSGGFLFHIRITLQKIVSEQKYIDKTAIYRYNKICNGVIYQF